jgi:hypothetical protein
MYTYVAHHATVQRSAFEKRVFRQAERGCDTAQMCGISNITRLDRLDFRDGQAAGHGEIIDTISGTFAQGPDPASIRHWLVHPIS